MNTPTPTEAADYGEPWIADQEHIFDRDGGAVADMWSPHSERIASCVNACRGIPDPEAALRAARDEFAHLIRLVEPFIEAGGRIPGLATMNGAKHALKLLTPAP